MIAAIERNRPAFAEMILEEDLDPNSLVEKSKWDDHLLHWTVKFNSPECAKVIISKLKIRSYNLQVLLKFSAELEIQNDRGETPLHRCGKFGSVPVLKVRIEGIVHLSFYICLEKFNLQYEKSLHCLVFYHSRHHPNLFAPKT